MKPLLFALLIFILAACQKERKLPLPSNMHYINFNDTKIGYREGKNFDLDGNGTDDISFRIYAVGDPIMQMDKYQYCAVLRVESNFPMKHDENIDIRNTGDVIPINNSTDFEWYSVSSVILAQKNIGMVDPPFWSGVWKDVQHKYLPIQLMKSGKRYNGWVEISFDQVNEKIVLHRSGISTIPEIDIRAGQ